MMRMNHVLAGFQLVILLNRQLFLICYRKKYFMDQQLNVLVKICIISFIKLLLLYNYLQHLPTMSH